MIYLDELGQLLERDEFQLGDEGSPYFDEIISFIEKNAFPEAAALIKGSFDQGYLDIRCVMYYFYIYFLQEGIRSFLDIFPLIRAILGENWEKITPINKREQHAQKSISWLFSRQIKTFEHVNRSFKSGQLDPLKKYTAGVSPEMVKEIVSLALRLNDTLIMHWEHSNLSDQLMHIVKSIGEFTQITFQKPVVETIETAPAPTTPKKEEPPPKENPSFLIPFSELEPSERMNVFYRKLKAFQRLIEQKDYRKAAVIADDIEQQIENFNPVIHFPKLFIHHYGLHAKYANKLEESRDGSSYKMLEKLYHADLNTFIDWKDR